MTVYNTAAFHSAHTKFLDDAKSLTDKDLAQFAIVDPTLAERARARRAGYVEADTDTDAEKNLLAKVPNYKALRTLLTDHVGPMLATYRHRIDESRDLIVALEQRIAALERKPSVKFRGVYEHGKAYQPGDAATHHGSLWICTAATTGEPNRDFVAWKLAVKKGDAR